MTPLQFETDYGPMWAELEAALAQVDGGRRRLFRKPPTTTAPDAARLALLYRSACEHLALARARAYPAHQTARLEALTERAHQLIYRHTDYGVARLARLFLVDFPQAVRAHWRYVLVAGLVFGLPLVLLGVATYLDPGFILSMHDAQNVREYEQMYGPGADAIGRERAAETDWMMFGFYIKNNISISFQCFAAGIFLGIGSLYFLAYNGIVAGSLAGYLTARGHGETFYSFVITHGAFELTAIVLSGAAGLRLGHALLAPGRLTRRAALELAARESAVLVYGVIAMLLVAAALEAFWSSARWVAPGVKFGVGGVCWAMVIAYFVGQGRPRATPPRVPRAG
ncbi:MAG: stage II sporulation protein M [Burkholderiales bacterium]